MSMHLCKALEQIEMKFSKEMNTENLKLRTQGARKSILTNTDSVEDRRSSEGKKVKAARDKGTKGKTQNSERTVEMK